jgi:hypothetical protein
MRSLTNAPIVVAGVVVGGPLAGRANGPVARVGDTASPEWRSCVEVSLLEGGSSLEGPFAFRPTKQDTHASRVAPTSPAKAADSSGKAGLESEVVALPQRARAFALGLAVGRDSRRRTPPWRRRALQWRRRSRQQPTAARNSVAADGIVTSCSRLGSVLRFESSALRLARRLGLVSRFSDPGAAITSRPGPLALLPNYQLDAGAPAPTTSAEALNESH